MYTLKTENFGSTPELGVKAFDIRYMLHNEYLNQIGNKRPVTNSFYWVGIIELSMIQPQKKYYPISFIDSPTMELTIDGEYLRHSDGALVEPYIKKTYEYNLNLLHADLFKGKLEGFKYLYILLKETVNEDGSREVKLMYLKGDEDKFGVASHLLLSPYECKSLTISLMQQSNVLKECTILLNDAYFWSN